MKSNIPFNSETKFVDSKDLHLGAVSIASNFYLQKSLLVGKVIMLVIIGLLLSFQLMAQEYQFKVLANQGDNLLKTSDGSRNELLKVGSTLQEGDKLILAENSYVGLMHPNGKTMEIKTAGEFEVSELAAKAGEGNSVAGKYADFIMTRMAENDAEVDENHRKYLNVTGAVERKLDSSAIKVMMPNSTEVFGSEAFIKWTDLEVDKYVVTVRNMYDVVLLTKETSEPQLKLNLNQSILSKERLVIVKVEVKNNKALASEGYGIKKVAAPKAEAINADLAVLKEAIQEDSALDKLILASFFEDNNLLVDALANYEAAIAINPTVKEYKAAYAQFVSRHNLLN